MKVTLKFFASVREQVGVSEEQLDLAGAVDTVGALRHLLVARGGAWAAALAGSRALRMACDQVMCGEDTPLRDGAEVAFFPPVTGG
jgi:molybdopterin synthase sulfur carrier subunit